MKISKILKCIFIPFYWGRETNWVISNGHNPTPFLWGCLQVTWIVCRFGYGYSLANDPKECILRSIGDVVITPMYALGCNVGKDRFNIKVN